MPIVPNSSAAISTDVPAGASAPIAQAGIISGAVSGLGEQINRSALAVIDQMQHAEAKDASERTLLQNKFDAEDKMHELTITHPDGYITGQDGKRVQNPDGSARTITQEFRDWSDAQYKKGQDAMPSALAQQLYKERAAPFYTDQVLAVRNIEWQKRVESYKRGHIEGIVAQANRLKQAPDMNAMYSSIDDATVHNTEQTGKLYSPQQAHDNNKADRNVLIDSQLDGLYSNALAEPKRGMTRVDQVNYALAVLHGGTYTDPQTGKTVGIDTASILRKQLGKQSISEIMDPNKKSEMIDKFLRLMPQAKQMDLSTMNEKFADAVAHLKLGKVGQDVPFNELYGLAQKALSSGAITDYHFANKVGELFAQDRGVALLSDPAFLLLNKEQQDKKIKSFADGINTQYQKLLPPAEAAAFPAIGGKVTEEIVKNMQEMRDRTNELAAKDFGGFLAKYDPQSKKLYPTVPFEDMTQLRGSAPQLRTIMNQEKAVASLRGEDVAVELSKDARAKMVNFINSDNTAYSSVHEGLRALHDVSPRNYNSIINAMVEKDGLNPAYRLALAIPENRQASLDLVQTIKDEKIIRQNALPILQNAGIPIKDVEADVASSLAPYTAAIARENPESPINNQYQKALHDTVTTKALKIISDSNGAVSSTDAAKRATDSILGLRFGLVEVGGKMFTGTTKTTLRLPADLTDGERENVANRASRDLSVASLQKAGAIAPPLKNGMPDTSIPSEKFYEQVHSTGIPVANPAGTGYFLKYLDRRTNSLVNVYVPGKDNKPVPYFVPFSEARKPIVLTPQEKSPGQTARDTGAVPAFPGGRAKF